MKKNIDVKAKYSKYSQSQYTEYACEWIPKQ